MTKVEAAEVRLTDAQTAQASYSILAMDSLFSHFASVFAGRVANVQPV
jgi:hypothetical protein